MGSPTPPCWATPQYACNSGALRNVHKPSTTDVMTAEIEMGRKHKVERTTRGPDLCRGVTCRHDHRVLVMAHCRERFARARVTLRPSGTADRTEAKHPRSAEEVVFRLSKTESTSEVE